MLESVHDDKNTNISENRKDRANHKFIANYFSTVPQIIFIGSKNITKNLLKYFLEGFIYGDNVIELQGRD